jgi:hypothetical protein
MDSKGNTIIWFICSKRKKIHIIIEYILTVKKYYNQIYIIYILQHTDQKPFSTQFCSTLISTMMVIIEYLIANILMKKWKESYIQQM